MGVKQTPPNVQRGRYEWVDAAKGLGIILVVIGHVNAGLHGAELTGSLGPLLDGMTGWIYSFHMPVFFVLAGMFTPSSLHRHRPGEFVREKTVRLLYPYFIWGILQTSVQAALSGATNTSVGPWDLLRLFYEPPMQFWFLPCLLLVFLVYATVAKCGGGAVAFTVIVCAVSVALQATVVSPFSIAGRFRDNVPYFALGVIAAKPLSRFGSVPIPYLVALVAGFGMLSVILAGIRTPLPGNFPLPVAGIAFLIALATILVRCGALGRWTAGLGRISLEIYLAHVLALAGIRIILARVFGVTNVEVHWVAGVVAGLAGPILLVSGSRLLGFNFLFSPPARLVPARDKAAPA